MLEATVDPVEGIERDFDNVLLDVNVRDRDSDELNELVRETVIVFDNEFDILRENVTVPVLNVLLSVAVRSVGVFKVDVKVAVGRLAVELKDCVLVEVTGKVLVIEFDIVLEGVLINKFDIDLVGDILLVRLTSVLVAIDELSSRHKHPIFLVIEPVSLTIVCDVVAVLVL